MFCVKKSLRIATVLYIYIKEEKRNEEYRVLFLPGKSLTTQTKYRVQVNWENLKLLTSIF